ncbi:putative site-specific recombinase [Gordonia malaquae NBRC 108250]|uniref:Putative site-specific recombinase n=2 Tax=Gordonia malaquae TaxID=410332 RepID=M3VCC2_GORML|nr:putative site-specific recombinase [Gordonia malaquae NBRC 108250]
MRISTTSGGMLLGYARGSVRAAPIEAQIDALSEAGVVPARIYSDDRRTSDGSHERPGWTALLDYARSGDTAVVVGIDRLGRTVPEMLASARDLSDREIGLLSIREGIDTSDPAGSMIVGVLASLASLDEEPRPAGRRRGSHRAEVAVGRPRALDDSQIATAERMRADGLSVPAIAEALGVSRATLYRALAERRSVR